MRSYTSTYRVEIHYPLNGWVTVVIGGNRAAGLGPRQANRIAEDQRRSETYYARLPGCPARRVRVVHEQTGAKLLSAPTTRSTPTVNLPTEIERRVRAWPQWSPAERERMDELVIEIIRHCSGGDGNQFIDDWCRRNLADLLPGFAKPAPAPDGTLFPGSQVCRRISGPSRSSSNTPRLF